MPRIGTSTDSTSVIDRIADILLAVGAQTSPMPLGALSHQTGLPKPTALRLARSLAARGLLIASAAGWCLGPTVGRLGAAYHRSEPLTLLLSPVLHRLVALTGESAAFYTPTPDGPLCRQRADSGQPIREHLPEGGLLPSNCGAVARVLAAVNPAEPGDPMSITVRRRGVLPLVGDRDPLIAEVAAPVFGLQGLAGVLLIAGPHARFDGSALDAAAQALLTAAQEMTEALGGAVL